MSGADHFRLQEINVYTQADTLVDVDQAVAEHAEVAAALESAGIKILRTPAPEDCPDGVYTATGTSGYRRRVVMLVTRRPPAASLG